MPRIPLITFETNFSVTILSTFFKTIAKMKINNSTKRAIKIHQLDIPKIRNYHPIHD